MDKIEDDFVREWRSRFPGVASPRLHFNKIEDVEEVLSSSRQHLKHLQQQVDQSTLYNSYLQTLVNSNRTKKPAPPMAASTVGAGAGSASAMVAQMVMPPPVTAAKPHLRAVPSVDMDVLDESAVLDSAASKRKSKVLENVKLFESKRDSVKGASGDGSMMNMLDATSSLQRNPTRRRTSYLEMWECKSGQHQQQDGSSSLTRHASLSADGERTFGPRDSCATTSSSARDVTNPPSVPDKPTSCKPQPHQGGKAKRSDYVEVWRCKTGTSQVDLGVVYDDQDTFQTNNHASTDQHYPHEEDTSYNKRHHQQHHHHTMAAHADVKNQQPANSNHNNMTWPAKLPHYSEEEDMLSSHAEDRFSRTFSDEDFYDDDDEDDDDDDEDSDSDHTENLSMERLRAATVSASPYEDMRGARTTNERLGAAISTLWISQDNHHHTKMGRTSLISLQSCELPESSDDDILTEDRSSMLSDLSSNNSPALDPTRSMDRRLKHTDSVKSSASSTAATVGTTAPTTTTTTHHDDQQQQADNNKQPSPSTAAAAAADDNTQDKSAEASSSSTAATCGNLPGFNFNRASPYTDSIKEKASEMVDYQKVRNVAEAEKVRMRRWVLTSMVENEETYLQYLNTLLLYMKPLHATIATSQPVMTSQDYETLFFRVKDLHDLHSDFYSALKPRLDRWESDTQVGEIFDKLLSKLNLYKDYLQNYKKAMQTVDKCSKDNTQFANIISELKVQAKNSDEICDTITLSEALYKPVERVMRTTCALQDLLKQTPHRHPDYQVLRKVLKYSQNFLEKINIPSSFKPKRVPSSVAALARDRDRELVKDGFLVEVSGDGQRKLRNCFLYTDLLLCAKQKTAAGMFHHSKISYECKWYIPLADLSFHPFKDSDQLPEYTVASEEHLRQLTLHAQQVKMDIEKETGRRNRGNNSRRREERLRKKLGEFSSRIVLASPSLPLKLYHQCGKSYLFLMSSDYERIEWQESIMKRQESCFKSFPLTHLEISRMLAQKTNAKELAISSLMMSKEDDLLSGYLTVTIHTAKGFLTKCNPYCCLEVDSFGQFQTKARTRHCEETLTPEWEEEFELEVDGAQQLRILIFEKTEKTGNLADDDADTVLIAKTKMALTKELLGREGEWKQSKFLVNEIEISCSFKFVPREHSLQRLPSKISTGVFGVKIDQVGKRDSSGIPSIVRKLVDEVERRGMDEVGIYRVSGVVSGINSLKAAFDNNRKDVNKIMNEVDINAVAGVLKLYFRELPEPLFTNSRYRDFVKALELTDPDTKLCTFKKLLADLPSTNYKTLHYLRNHLIKVAKKEKRNKMNLHNIATVFGPTLLRPADNNHISDVTEINIMRLDVHFQMDVLLYVLEHVDMEGYEQVRASRTRLLNNQQQQQHNNRTTSPPVNPSQPVPTNQSPHHNYHQRYRPYEEISDVIATSQPPHPAPRKAAPKPVVTDL